MHPPRPFVLAITNRKGGTGKTTTAVNLAAGFAARGQRTLLIDLDTQGHCALGLGMSLGEGQPAAQHLFAETPIALEEAIVPSRWEGLHLIPADTSFQHDRTPSDEGALARALAAPAIAEGYDLILIDTPPSLDRLLLNALGAAHATLIPFVPHPLAEEGVRQLARLFFRVAMASNANLRLLGVLPIQFDGRTGQHKRGCAQLAHQYGRERLLPPIRNDIRLAEAFAAGQPIEVFAPRSRGAEDYRRVLDQLLERMAITDA
ncbi:MAG: ParA family protein [Chromatiaceae bacterium]|nr:ParA family protein [Chromatiaceae bacterium]